jgi:hypothetical protein
MFSLCGFLLEPLATFLIKLETAACDGICICNWLAGSPPLDCSEALSTKHRPGKVNGGYNNRQLHHYCHMSKKSRVGRSGLIFFFFFLLSTKPEIVVPGSRILFRYLISENSGKMTNYAVFLPSLLSISTKS